MALEDFTTYSETDPETRIAFTANHIDSTISKNADAYLYKDKGVGHFTDFEHLITVQGNDGAPCDNNAIDYIWAVTNDIADWKGLVDNNKHAIAVNLYDFYDTPGLIGLRECHNGSVYADNYTSPASNTPYYLTIEKSGTTFTCKIYSDASRTTLVDTLTLTLQANNSWRYIFAVMSYNVANIDQCNDDVDDLDLQEAAGLSIPVAMHHYGHIISKIIRG